MGNQISNEHERNKSADNVLERRGRRGSDDEHPSKNSFRANTSFIIEKTIDKISKTLKSPKGDSRRRVSSPGLEILATELKRGNAQKKISNKEVKNINSTLKFVENSIYLNEGPLLTLNIPAVHEIFPPNQNLINSRMSFSSDFNDPNQRYKFKMESYFTGRDKLTKAYLGGYTKPKRIKTKAISLVDVFGSSRVKSPSFEIAPQQVMMMKADSLDIENLNKEQNSIEVHNVFQTLVHQAMEKEPKGSHNEMLKELKNIQGAISRIREREKSFNTEKNAITEKLLTKPVSLQQQKKTHLHSKSEITRKKNTRSPTNELFCIDEYTDNPVKPWENTLRAPKKSGFPKPFVTTERNYPTSSENLKVGNVSNRPEKRDLGLKKKSIASTSSSNYDTEPKKVQHTRKEEMRPTEVDMNRQEARRPKIEAKPRVVKQAQPVLNKENKPNNNKLQEAISQNQAQVPNKKEPTEIQRKNPSLKKNRNNSEGSSAVKRFDLLTYKSPKPQRKLSPVQENQSEEWESQTSSQVHREIAKRTRLPSGLSELSEHVSQKIDTVESGRVETVEDNTRPVEAVLDLSAYIAKASKYISKYRNKDNEAPKVEAQKLENKPKEMKPDISKDLTSYFGKNGADDGLLIPSKENISSPKRSEKVIVISYEGTTVKETKSERLEEEDEDFFEEEMKEYSLVDEIRQKLEKLSVVVGPSSNKSRSEEVPQKKYVKNLSFEPAFRENESFGAHSKKTSKTKTLINNKINCVLDLSDVTEDRGSNMTFRNIYEDHDVRESRDVLPVKLIKVFPSHGNKSHFDPVR